MVAAELSAEDFNAEEISPTFAENAAISSFLSVSLIFTSPTVFFFAATISTTISNITTTASNAIIKYSIFLPRIIILDLLINYVDLHGAHCVDRRFMAFRRNARTA